MDQVQQTTESASAGKGTKIPITLAFDVLFTIVIFNGFSQWHYIHGLMNRGLVILMYLIIINDWMSLRASSKVYNVPIMFLDLGDVFIFINIFEMLKTSGGSHLTYQPFFWVYLTVLCLIYGFWDFVLADKLEWPAPKTLRKWAFAMFGASATCLLTYFAVRWVSNATLSTPWTGILPYALITPAVVYWIVLLGVWTANKIQQG